MNKKTFTAWLVGLCICGTMFYVSTFLGATASFAGDIILVCNKAIPVDSLGQKEVRNIFLGKKIEWENDEKIVLAVLKSKTIHKQFLDIYVGMTASKYRTYWKKMIFTGRTSSSPKIMKDEEELLKYVAETAGGIGYVSADANIENVKVLFTNCFLTSTYF